MTHRFRSAVLAVALVGILPLAACSRGESTAATTGTSGATLTVFAASSLKDTFTALGKAFEASHTGTRVEFNFGASSTLATNLLDGAPADVFASASTKDMMTVSGKGVVNTATEFATNRITLAVPRNNPAHITSITDLSRSSVTFVVCRPDVPCGVAAAYTLDKAGITRKAVTQAADVKSTLNVLQLGEADAGFVYVTDVLASGGSVVKIDVPDTLTSPVHYPIATVKTSKHAELAQQFLLFVTSADGQAALAQAGFGKP